MLQSRNVLLDVIIVFNATYLSKCVNVFISYSTVSLQASLIRSLRNILSVVSHISSIGSCSLDGLAALKETYGL